MFRRSLALQANVLQGICEVVVVVKEFRAKPSGWRYESQRHSLAAKGIKTSSGRFFSERTSAYKKSIDKMSDEEYMDSIRKKSYGPIVLGVPGGSKREKLDSLLKEIRSNRAEQKRILLAEPMSSEGRAMQADEWDNAERRDAELKEEAKKLSDELNPPEYMAKKYPREIEYVSGSSYDPEENYVSPEFDVVTVANPQEERMVAKYEGLRKVDSHRSDDSMYVSEIDARVEIRAKRLAEKYKIDVESIDRDRLKKEMSIAGEFEDGYGGPLPKHAVSQEYTEAGRKRQNEAYARYKKMRDKK